MKWEEIYVDILFGFAILSAIYLIYVLYEDRTYYQKNTMKIVRQCVSSGIKGAVFGCVLGGPESAVVGGIIYGIVAPLGHLVDRVVMPDVNALNVSTTKY